MRLDTHSSSRCKSSIVVLLMAVLFVAFTGCMGPKIEVPTISGIKFDKSTATHKDLKLGNDDYTLSCYIPKDTSIYYNNPFESYKLGYNIYSFYMINNAGRMDFYIYKLTSGVQSLEYFFGTSEDAYKPKALEDWNIKQLSAKGYDREFRTSQSTYMTELRGVKMDRIVRTISKDQRGNQIIAESCWFDYPNAFWFMTTTWPADYYNVWWSSDILLTHK